MTSHYSYAILLRVMATQLRPGRKKVTTSFVMTPELHKWFRQQYPQRGEQSYVIEELVKLLQRGAVAIAPKTT